MRIYLITFVLSIALLSCKNGSEQTQKEQYNYLNLSVAETKNIISTSDVKVIDVRTPSEIAEGKIAGALEIDFRAPNFKESITALDKHDSYIIYCRSGGRSAKAASIMSKAGFKKVSNMLGGYSAWHQE